DRDKGKRPLMAAAAQAGADYLVLTSDNPRSEDPAHILSDISAGLTQPAWRVEADRRSAIHATINAAQPEDWVLLAGKGHETYQIVGEQILPLSDIDEAQVALMQKAGL
ncbi:MAG: UDP-N-acetylmuramoyl-L-alanyl-D-glutamate--2,6-diaminopimelate ligase, partial [Pseudomonadota bacterium]